MLRGLPSNHGRRVHSAHLCAVLLVVASSFVFLAPAPQTASADAPPPIAATWSTIAAAGPALAGRPAFTCPAAGVCYFASEQVTARSTDGGATWTSTWSIAHRGVVDISCVTAQRCFALHTDGYVTATTDGFTTSAATLPVADHWMSAISCTSATACIALGEAWSGGLDAVTTEDSGASWTVHHIAAQGGLYKGIACASAMKCVAAGFGPAYVTTDSGASWQAVDNGPAAVDDVQCPSSTQCVAVGREGTVARSHDGGITWPEIDAYSEPFWSVSCASANTCVAVGGNTLASAHVVYLDGSISPPYSIVPGGIPPLVASSCNGNVCFAVSTASTEEFSYYDVRQATIVTSVDGGATWTSVPVPARTEYADVACSTALRCVAVGATNAAGGPAVGRSLVTDDGGTTWHEYDVPLGESLTTVTCTTSSCIAGVTITASPRVATLATSERGGAWQASVVPFELGTVDAVTCVSEYRCLAFVTSSVPLNPPGFVLTSGDGGRTWVAGAQISYSAVKGADCTDNGLCLAETTTWTGFTIGWRLKVSTDAGETWRSISTAALPVWGYPTATSCGTTFGCMLDRYATLDDGVTWRLIDTGGKPLAESCSVADACGLARLDDSDQKLGFAVTADRGATWQAAAPPPDAISVTQLECPVPARCFAITTDGSSGSARLVRGDLQFDGVGEATYVGVAPARLLDTRTGPGLGTVDGRYSGIGPSLSGTTTTLDIAGRGGVPANASAVVLTVSAVDPHAAGFVTFNPCGSGANAASLNYDAGTTVTNTVVAAVVTGQVCFSTYYAETDITVDVVGYFPAMSEFQRLAPGRLLETRAGPGLATVDGQANGIGMRPAGSVTEVLIGGRGGVPALAAAVTLNVTAIGPSGDGFLTVYPCETARPNAASVTYSADDVTGSAVVADLDSTGKVCVYTYAQTDLTIDVAGSIPAVSRLRAFAPQRVLETRTGPELGTVDGEANGIGRRSAGAVTRVRVGGRAGLAAGAGNAIVTVSAVDTAGPGFVTVYRCDAPRPNAAAMTYGAGEVRSNTLVVSTDDQGNVCIYTYAAADLTLDVVGSA